MRKLGFTRAAGNAHRQQLYEGIDVGAGTVGLITYMRTDSVNLANEAVDELRDFVTSKYGPDQIPKSPRTFKTTAKNAQEAHEAIPPDIVSDDPGRNQVAPE